jgi:hypothetical protein
MREREALCEAETGMCRSIKVLRNPEQAPTRDEIDRAALQFVRKISGYHKPSRANQEIFDRTVREIADASERMLRSLGARAAAAAVTSPG